MANAQEQLVADLKRTRRELEVRGRCIEELISHSGKVCLDGAVALACGITIGVMGRGVLELEENPRAQRVLRALADHIPSDRRIDNRRYVVEPRVQIYIFNDDDKTTDEECFDLIDKALAEAGGLADDPQQGRCL
jgi:hypothetical protein